MGDHHHHHLQQQGMRNGGGALELPPGFRFHPTDEEIIDSYLRPKVLDHSFTALAIGEADLNKSEPWELPLIANMGEKEWYFYCRKDRKYPTGHRANRATEAGYWKATGKDREIYRTGASSARPPVLVGTKKTLVFYKGRAPRGDKTNWVMHEYKLAHHDVWVVCRVFNKCSGIKKAPELIPAPEPAPAPAPAYHMTMAGRDNNSVDLRSISFPTMPPTRFPMEPEDFITMDSSPSFYSTDDGTSSMLLPPLPPMLGMGGTGFQMNTSHFGPTTLPVSSFYQQMGIGTSSDCGFMAEPGSRPTSMLSHDPTVSPGQTTSAAEISSVATAKSVVAATANMDM